MIHSNLTLSAHILSRLHIIGINHHNAGADVRGLFSINKDQFAHIATTAKEKNIVSIFVLSTCNRTEVYAFADNFDVLATILLSVCAGTNEQLTKCCYKKNGSDALSHLNKVAAGIDSQILGDYEILGQLKAAVNLSLSYGLIGPIMNRMLGFVIQASKKIKTNTKLSSGTVSVSYAAIEYLQKQKDVSNKKILVIGAGKFGRNVCKNLHVYIPCKEVTIINRTNEVAKVFAEAAAVQFDKYENLPALVKSHDVIIVCTNADEYTIQKNYFTVQESKIILDLSVPLNADPALAEMDNIQLADIDYLSRNFLNSTINTRKAALPAAMFIIEENQHKFTEWLNNYHISAHLNEWKFKLSELKMFIPVGCEMSGISEIPDFDKAQKAINKLAVGLRTNNDKGCRFINSINDYLALQ